MNVSGTSACSTLVAGSALSASLARPNCQVNADATKGHAFGIFMASVGALRPVGLRRRLPWALGPHG